MTLRFLMIFDLVVVAWAVSVTTITTQSSGTTQSGTNQTGTTQTGTTQTGTTQTGTTQSSGTTQSRTNQTGTTQTGTTQPRTTQPVSVSNISTPHPVEFSSRSQPGLATTQKLGKHVCDTFYVLPFVHFSFWILNSKVYICLLIEVARQMCDFSQLPVFRT